MITDRESFEIVSKANTLPLSLPTVAPITLRSRCSVEPEPVRTTEDAHAARGKKPTP
jgi:hypothetical protein